MTSDLDEKLKAFLDDVRTAKEAGYTIEAVYAATKHLAEAQAAHENKCDLRWERNAEHHASANARLTTLEAKAQGFERAEEITGNHNLQAIALAAEAKGLATAKNKHESVPPVATWLAKMGVKLTEKWALHVVFVVLGGLSIWIAHALHVLR